MKLSIPSKGVITLEQEQAVIRAYMKNPEAAERWFAYYSGTEPRPTDEVRDSFQAAWEHLAVRQKEARLGALRVQVS